MQLQCEQQHQHQRQPEIRHRDTDHGDKHADAVSGTVGMDCRTDAQGDTNQRRQQDTSRRKGQRFGEPLHQLCRDTGSLNIGISKASVNYNFLQEIEQTHKIGVVQT